jgi:hypothetical protein
MFNRELISGGPAIGAVSRPSRNSWWRSGGSAGTWSEFLAKIDTDRGDCGRCAV